MNLLTAILARLTGRTLAPKQTRPAALFAMHAQYYQTAGLTRPRTVMGYELDRNGNWRTYMGG